MFSLWRSRSLRFAAVCSVVALGVAGSAPSAQSPQPASKQKVDADYTAKIKEYLQDPRITTELVDHLPASDTVPTPLKFLGRIVGTPGELTYAKDIHRYFEALDKASDRDLDVDASARPRKAATWCCWRSPTRRRSSSSDKYKGHAGVADRSAQDDRGSRRSS